MYKALIFAVGLLPLAAFAGSVTDIGATTLTALEKQRSGENAVEVRPMLKDVADRTYERYLESFTHPIPAEFERDQEFLSGN